MLELIELGTRPTTKIIYPKSFVKIDNYNTAKYSCGVVLVKPAKASISAGISIWRATTVAVGSCLCIWKSSFKPI